MPIYQGNYVAPVWINDMPPAINQTELLAMSGTLAGAQILTGSGAPTQYTSGVTGQRYADTSTTPYTIYKLVTAAEDANEWKVDADANGNLALDYDPTSTYEEGQYCIYQGKLYKANQDIDPAEAWTAAHWDTEYLAEDLAEHVSDTANPHSVTAEQVAYDNSGSGLTADDVQEAIDEVAGSIPTVPTAYTSDPAMDGTASPGSSGSWARGDHVHPSDDNKADIIIASASGAIASFPDGGAYPVHDLTIGIEPVQSGSGDPSPSNVRPISGWSSVGLMGMGKNKVDSSSFYVAGPPSGITLTLNDGTITANGSVASATTFAFYQFTLPAGTYTFSCTRSGISVRLLKGYSYVLNNVGSFTVDDSTQIYRLALYFAGGTVYSNASVSDCQIELGSTATPYAPYSGQTTTITIPTPPGTVYGGTLDVTNGVLTAYPYYASYNGETLVGPWVSSMDAYAPGTTPTIGAQVVDMGGSGTTYPLAATQISTLLGDNTMWADSGDIAVQYRADTGLYLNRKANFALGNNFGVCSTAAATAAKTVTIPGITELVDGLSIRVLFEQTLPANATLNINNLGAYPINGLAETAVPANISRPLEVLDFVYYNSSWIAIDEGTATTVYYGLVRLTSSVSSTSTTLAATGSAVKTAYDAATTNLAPVEASSTASSNHAVGSYLVMSGVLYEVTTAIASGETITPGTNVTAVTVTGITDALDTRVTALETAMSGLVSQLSQV